MFISVDTISFVQNCNVPSNITHLAVSKKPHKFGNKWVFHNTESKNEPRIEIYPDYNRSYSIRATIELSKLFYGNNIKLLDSYQIETALEIISKNVQQRTTIPFDAINAQNSRVDYAANLYLPSLFTYKFIRNYSDYRVNYLNRHIINSTTVYFENTQRQLCMYDKYALSAKDKSISAEQLKQAEGLIRLEYRFLNKLAVNRLAKRLGFEGNLAKYLLAPRTIKTVMNEMSELLNIEKFNPSVNSPFRTTFQQTNDIKKAIQHTGFSEAYKEFGEDFYLRDELDISKTTYDRIIKEIQESVVSITMSSKVPNLNQSLCGSLETASGKKCGSKPKNGDKRCFRHKNVNGRQEKKVDSTILQNIPALFDEYQKQEQSIREKFLIANEKHLGNITKTCLEVGIHRTTFYKWKESTKQIDVKFIKKFNLIKSKIKASDIAENRIISEI